MSDGSVILVEIARGTLSRVTPGGVLEVVADLGGGPNGAAIGPDGAVYVCNNGGFSWLEIGGRIYPHDRPDDYSGGRIERVDLTTGAVERLYDTCDDHALVAPNDIVFDRTGGFWFTDLGKSYDRLKDRGAVYYAKPMAAISSRWFFPLKRPTASASAPMKTPSMWPKPKADGCGGLILKAPAN